MIAQHLPNELSLCETWESLNIHMGLSFHGMSLLSLYVEA